jgi:CheY-like chemotaxis protein
VKRALVVEDNKVVAAVYKNLLSLDGLAVEIAADGEDAVQQMARSMPDIVLLDLKMPQESGFQVACKIKFFSQLQGVPIIAMTAYFKDDYADLLRTYGIKHCLTKPFDTVELVSRIEDAL